MTFTNSRFIEISNKFSVPDWFRERNARRNTTLAFYCQAIMNGETKYFILIDRYIEGTYEHFEAFELI